MKKKHLVILTLSCLLNSVNTFCQESYLNHELTVEKRVELLMKEMTLDEKIGQMCQYIGDVPQNTKNDADDKINYVLGLEERAKLIKEGKIGSFLKVANYQRANYLQEIAAESRLKIPLLIATDAIHGHGMYEEATTIYPTEIGIASTFDTTMAYKIAKFTAREMRATGHHWTFSPNIDLVRDVRWGRIGESFGEDPLLISKMGVAMINGYQGDNFKSEENVLACAKHFIAGGIPVNGLNGAPADISERTLYEMFFPPFQDAIKNNVFSIMPAHNEINGIPCHAHQEYLTDLMRDEWKFKGIYVSDWMDIEKLSSVHKIAKTEKQADEIAVNAGLDIHMSGVGFFDNVKKSVEEGIIPLSRINDAASKILYAKFQLGLFEKRYVEAEKVNRTLLKQEHLDLALESAQKSIVLLKNKNGTLPLDKQSNNILIIGPNANSQAILGDWSRIQPDSNVTTVYEGISKIVNNKTKINYLECNRHDSISSKVLKDAGNLMKLSDVGIVVIGEYSNRFKYDLRTSGENLDRTKLIPGNQIDLVKAIKKTGKPVIVVLINGAPVGSEWLVDNADAIIEAWEPGMFGGQAIAEVIFGEYNPGGRLPITIPRSVGHLQSFYNYKPSSFHRGRPFQSISKPLFEFGHGLSYTSFDYSNLNIEKSIKPTDDLKISFNIKNTGKYNGDEVVLIYLNDIISSITTPVKKLVYFERIHLIKGEQKRLEMVIPNKMLGLFDKNMKYIVEQGEFEINIGNKLQSIILVE